MKQAQSGYYMYSVIQENATTSFGPIGLSETDQDQNVFTISAEGLACVVSQSRLQEWEISRENTIKHQKVNEFVMQDRVVLPIKFCTVAESSQKIVEQFLKPRQKELLDHLHNFSDKQEHSVKAFWVDIDRVYAHLLEENIELKAWRDRLAKLPPEKARNDMIILGQQVKDALQKKQEVLQAALFAKLSELATEAKTNKLIGNRMVLNCAFLITTEQQAEFDQAVDTIAQEYEGDIIFKYFGPTPPANFIEIEVNWD